MAGTIKMGTPLELQSDGRFFQTSRMPYATPFSPATNPVFRGASKLVHSSGRTTSTVNKPSGTVSGDLILLHLLLENGATTLGSAPSGFLPIISPTQYAPSGNGATSYGMVYYKIAGGSEPSTYSFTHTSSATEITGVSYSGVDPLNPFDVTPSTAQGTGTTATAGALSTVNAYTTIVFFGGMWSGWSQNVTPSGYTQRSWSSATGLLAADVAQNSGGTTGTPSATSSTNTGDGWTAFLLALRPVTAGPGSPFPSSSGLIADPTNNSDSGVLGLFLHVQTSRSISITAVRYYVPFAIGANHQAAARFYSTTGTAVFPNGSTAESPIALSVELGDFQTLTLSTPLIVNPGVDFYFGVYLSGTAGTSQYSALASAFPSPILGEALITVAKTTGNPSRYRYTTDTLPITDDGNTGNSTAWYGVDVVYT